MSSRTMKETERIQGQGGPGRGGRGAQGGANPRGHCFRHPGGGAQALPRDDLEARQARLGDGRHLGQIGRARQ